MLTRYLEVSNTLDADETQRGRVRTGACHHPGIAADQEQGEATGCRGESCRRVCITIRPAWRFNPG